MSSDRQCTPRVVEETGGAVETTSEATNSKHMSTRTRWVPTTAQTARRTRGDKAE